MLAGEDSAKSIEVPEVRFGWEKIFAGTLVRSSCLNPPRSPSELSSGAPVGGETRSLTAVSSRPLTTGAMPTLAPLSKLVRLEEPYSVAPVPYIIRSESNGSISSDSVIQPSFGDSSGAETFALKVSHGTEEMSIAYWSTRVGYPLYDQNGFQVAPESVERQIWVSGHHEL